jgi:hypothetical protein
MSSQTDAQVAEQFLQARLPEWIVDKLGLYLSKIRYPLAVRLSSSRLMAAVPKRLCFSRKKRFIDKVKMTNHAFM